MNFSSTPKVVLRRFGIVADEEVDELINTVRNCYNRLAPHEVSIVDLYVFDRSSRVEAFMSEESRRVGVASSSFDDLFFSMHDAWTGISRIIICLERMKELPTLAKEGGIHHEVGHSVLHGSLRYYIFSVPCTLQDLAKRFNMSRQYVTNMTYLISLAVKDYEVSRLLRKLGYDKDQIAFAKCILTPTESDKTMWEISSKKPHAEILCLMSYMKLVGHVTPFLTVSRSRTEMSRCLKESLSFLPREFATKILEETPRIFQQLEQDTLNNVDRFAHLINERIIQPLYGARGY